MRCRWRPLDHGSSSSTTTPDVQRALAEASIATPIIFISASADIPTTVQAMETGAVEFLTKPFDDQEMLDAIYGALVRDQAARDQQYELSTLLDRYGRLTPRERQVMALVVSARLDASRHTKR